MKLRHIVFGIGLSLTLGLSSCEKVIEVEPEYNKDGSQIFKSLDDYEFVLTGAYSQFRAVGYYGSGAQTTSTWAMLPDLMGNDFAQTAEDLGNWQNQTNWNYTSDEADIAQAWVAAYNVITQANLVLRNIEQFSTANPTRVNRIKGQALAIRGMVHFDLLRFWGESYDRNSTKLGVPYKLTVNKDDMPSRLSVKETYDKIFADLKEAETLLGNVDRAINTSSSKAMIDRLATRALLARLNLYAKDFAEAERYATLVISERPLASKANFPNIWKDASVDEVIWSVTFSAGEGSPSSGTYNGPSNRNRFRPTNPIMESFDQVNDIRFPAYFSTRVRSGVTRPIINKFLGRGTAVDNLVNWKVLRTGEMYLIRAEARALQGKTVEALEDLNTLRAARINGYLPVVLAGQPLLDAIYLERRKELFGEGHRWFDARRTTSTITRTDCGTIARDCSIVPADREWVWPIPQAEIDANSNIKNQQSAGY